MIGKGSGSGGMRAKNALRNTKMFKPVNESTAQHIGVEELTAYPPLFDFFCFGVGVG